MATSASFTTKISKLIYLIFSDALKCRLPDSDTYNKDMVFAYIAAGCAGIIDWWVKTGCSETEEAIAKKLTHLASITIIFKYIRPDALSLALVSFSAWFCPLHKVQKSEHSLFAIRSYQEVTNGNTQSHECRH